MIDKMSVSYTHLPEAVVENLLVLDGGTGQNAISQARQFAEMCIRDRIYGD